MRRLHGAFGVSAGKVCAETYVTRTSKFVRSRHAHQPGRARVSDVQFSAPARRPRRHHWTIGGLMHSQLSTGDDSRAPVVGAISWEPAPHWAQTRWPQITSRRRKPASRRRTECQGQSQLWGDSLSSPSRARKRPAWRSPPDPSNTACRSRRSRLVARSGSRLPTRWLSLGLWPSP